MSTTYHSYRALSEDCETWRLGEQKWKIKRFSQNDLYTTFRGKVAAYEKETLTAYNSNKMSTDELYTVQDELTKHILTNALEGFSEETWIQVTSDPNVGRGALKHMSEEIWSFLMVYGTREEMLLFKQRYQRT